MRRNILSFLEWSRYKHQKFYLTILQQRLNIFGNHSTQKLPPLSEKYSQFLSEMMREDYLNWNLDANCLS